MDAKYEKCSSEEGDLTPYEDLSSVENLLLGNSQIEPEMKRARLGFHTHLLFIHTLYVFVYSLIAFALAHYLSKQYHGPALIYCESSKMLQARLN